MDERQRRVDHFNAGAAGGEHESSYEADQRAGVRRLHGAKDIHALFPRDIPATGTPWPSASRRKGEPKFDQEAVSAELSRPPSLVRIDPRILSSGQPGLVRAGVAHYLDNPEYAEVGHTFEAGRNLGNQFPFVVTKRHPVAGHEHVIISGHHRAAAALLRGEHLRTRWIEQQ